MKQDGSSLIFVLLILLLVSSISIALFNSSLLEYKISTHMKNRSEQFYETEHCLQTAIKPLNLKTHYPVMLAINDQSMSWWQAHGIGCDEHTWWYAQLLHRATKPEMSYFVVTAYHKQNIMLQAVVAVTEDGRHSLQSWRQIK